MRHLFKVGLNLRVLFVFLLAAAAVMPVSAPGNLLNGRFEQGLRHSLMWVISIGTNEIQRSLIAQRGLGLPR